VIIFYDLPEEMRLEVGNQYSTKIILVVLQYYKRAVRGKVYLLGLGWWWLFLAGWW
jgi:hypothetical protein